MQNYRISLNDLPPEGKEFNLDDQAVWQNSITEFGMDCRVTKPLSASIYVLPTDGGWLVRGTLTGGVALPCSRCAEDAIANVNARFEDFEQQPESDELDGPGGHSTAQPREDTPESRLVFDNNAPMLDLAAICWEELMLALPVTPLCNTTCKGLCPNCGANLNEGLCACEHEEIDPRMAVLRGLTLHKN
ncbi:MAG: DUF177 domain-containing protein [Desulfovibrio sp.]|nr:DUF177 domain-containing protein [Desulfovibrio sp.]